MSREELEKRALEARYNLVSSKDKETIDILEELAIKALEQKLNRAIEDYENEIEDLHNRLDIAEYDKERLREEVTNLEAKIKALEQETILDKIKSEIDRQRKWLLQAGYTAYNLDIAFNSIKSVIERGQI